MGFLLVYIFQPVVCYTGRVGEGYSVERGAWRLTQRRSTSFFLCFSFSVRPAEIVLQACISVPTRGMQEVAKSAVLHLLNGAQIELSEI